MWSDEFWNRSPVQCILVCFYRISSWYSYRFLPEWNTNWRASFLSESGRIALSAPRSTDHGHFCSWYHEHRTTISKLWSLQYNRHCLTLRMASSDQFWSVLTAASTHRSCAPFSRSCRLCCHQTERDRGHRWIGLGAGEGFQSLPFGVWHLLQVRMINGEAFSSFFKLRSNKLLFSREKIYGQNWQNLRSKK